MNILKLLKRKKTQAPRVSDVGTRVPKKQLAELRDLQPMDLTATYDAVVKRTFQKLLPVPVREGVAMDGACFTSELNRSLHQTSGWNGVPGALASWYGSQSFIGYQLAATFAQHWLISKCCLMPAKDATRNGYEVTVNDGTEVSNDVLGFIKEKDIEYKINENLIEFVQMGRVFGIRIALFVVDTDNPTEYYGNPFNIDGVLPGSYRGISQIDPYWVVPQLTGNAVLNPMDIDFYEPPYWIINGINVHKSHLVIFRTEEVADILKPTYLYGGVPIPQKIYERVYCAERTANEAPALALSKRTTVIKTDTAQVAADPAAFMANMQNFASFRDNFGVKILGLDEESEQYDLSLADLDAVIMTQYQIVAAAANVPAVKLLGTTPKGFNATGEFEEANYHEELESIQTHDLTPLLDRHHALMIKSDVAPHFGIQPFHTTVTWNSLDAMTAEELAELNKKKAETGAVLMNSGAIDGEDERQRLITDPDSGYSGLAPLDPLELEESGEEPEESSSNYGA